MAAQAARRDQGDLVAPQPRAEGAAAAPRGQTVLDPLILALSRAADRATVPPGQRADTPG